MFGLGLIGTSLALDLRVQGFRVYGYDLKPEHLGEARRLQAIDEALEAPSGAFDAIVLAAPPRANLGLLAAGAAAPLWLDTGSVKQEIVRRAGAAGLPFVGGHPLAGTEGAGPFGALAGLFAGRGFALCPGGGPRAAAEEIVRALGARPIWIDAEEHDRLVARSSHLVYAWSCALAELLQGVPEELIGPAAREMLRVATSPIALWREILEMNRSGVDDAVRDAQAALEAAASGDEALLSAASRIARRLREDGDGG